jgi:dTMP kinase
VICDRYLASTLVLQARDGIAASYLLALNEGIHLPGLAVILTAEPEIITARLDRRGRHDRFEHDPAAASTETLCGTCSGRPNRLLTDCRCQLLESSPA